MVSHFLLRTFFSREVDVEEERTDMTVRRRSCRDVHNSQREKRERGCEVGEHNWTTMWGTQTHTHTHAQRRRSVGVGSKL